MVVPREPVVKHPAIGSSQSWSCKVVLQRRRNVIRITDIIWAHILGYNRIAMTWNKNSSTCRLAWRYSSNAALPLVYLPYGWNIWAQCRCSRSGRYNGRLIEQQLNVSISQACTSQQWISRILPIKWRIHDLYRKFKGNTHQQSQRTPSLSRGHRIVCFHPPAFWA